ncbi:MAG: single-stranded DNA-binding protein, partial [Alphaproteobacteria bacterium]|nr:single-stranded DNA-binding protein [Alphaproteobacteria bacterium]
GTVERNSGQKVDRTEWHRVVTFQDGLIDMLEKHAKKGRLIHVEGKMQTRRWRKQGEDSDRFSTEIIVVPGHRVQFYDKPNGAPVADAQASMDDTAAQTAAPASPPADLDDEVPF